LESSLNRFHRRDRLQISDIPLPQREWQRNKLEIIIAKMEQNDLFTDADIIWNSSPPISEKPLLFVDEYELGRRTITRWCLKRLKFNPDDGWRMLNTSVVTLGEKSKNQKLMRSAIVLYEKIRNCKPDSNLGLDDLVWIRRMSEQLALSLCIKAAGDYLLLKDSDSYMDGGLAESYYLGAINGFD